MEIQVLQFDERVGLGTFFPWLQELNIVTRFWRCDREQLPNRDATGPVLLLGGYMGVNERENLPYLQAAAKWIAAEVETGRPLLAVCLGGQLLAHALGGTVISQYRQEKGIYEIELTTAGLADPLFSGLPNPLVSFEWHNDSFKLPGQATLLAQTATCPDQAFRYRNAWGLQFHPEVDEQIVTDWSHRTGAGEEPLQVFRQWQELYLNHSRQLLKNFISTAQRYYS